MRPIDLTGRRFVRLLVTERAENNKDGQTRWRCICDCGNKTIVAGSQLRYGRTLSCGCYGKEQRAKHVERMTTHGKSNRREWWVPYSTWKTMRRRCYIESDAKYQSYGGRGIRVCERWNDFEKFYEDMGPKPSPLHSIDRIDNNGNYEPGNCRWALPKQQSRNTRRNRYLELDGDRKTVAEWVESTGLTQAAIMCRLRRGWDVRKTLVTPLRGTEAA